MAKSVPQNTQIENEIELKLLTDLRTARRIWSHAAVKPLLKQPPRTRHIKTVYFDTPDFALMGTGAAFRIRSTGNQFEQHLKLSGTAEGCVFHRQEWQAPISSNKPEFSAWDGEPAQITAPFQNALRPVFESDMERTDALLCTTEWDIEIAVDHGFIRALQPDGSIKDETPLVEVELELKRGNPIHIYKLALDLSTSLPLRAGWQSKAQRGFELTSGITPPVHMAGKLKPDDDLSHAHAIASILGDALTHYLANIPNLESEGAVEAVHQARIACRRIRAALLLATPFMDSKENRNISETFKAIANHLSPVRDIDVLRTQAIPCVIHAAETPLDIRLALEKTCLELHKRRNTILSAACKKLRSSEITQATLLLALRICQLKQSDNKERIDSFASFQIEKLYQPLKKRDKVLRVQDPLACHEIRIATKKLRYLIEFCAALYGKKKLQKYAKALAKLQNALGEANDVANILVLSRLYAPKTVESNMAMGAVYGWHLHRTRNNMQVALQVSSEIAAPPPIKKGNSELNPQRKSN